MEDVTALQEYFSKLQRAIDSADLKILKYKFVKKNRIDDLIVCALAVMPDVYKKAMKKRVQLDLYPSVSCYNRLTKIIKKTFFLMPDSYMIDFAEATTMLKSIKKNLESDIRNLEEQL
jgi:hypothetical protein